MSAPSQRNFRRETWIARLVIAIVVFAAVALVIAALKGAGS